MRLFEQLLTRNNCYIEGKILNPAGVMVHSTGADNPNLVRYVPGNAYIGWNTSGNHWDQSNAAWKRKFGVNLNKCVHAFIGKTADGGVATVQTLPWAMRGWHAGKSKGNNRYIGFEICEDGLDDPDYFRAAYREAVELTAMLCQQFGLDPLADGVVICHAEGCKRGVASNHGDVLHWFPRHGKTMDDFRADVARMMETEVIDMTEERLREIIREEVANMKAEAAKLPASGWAEKGLAEAVKLGITDGTRPQDTATRQEVALMVKAAIYAQ